MSRLLIPGLVLALSAAVAPRLTLASSVVVPDEAADVQSAIDSGADTVLVREGVYPERPSVDRPLVLRRIGLGQRPQLQGLDIFNSNFWATPPLLSIEGLAFSGRVEYTTVTYRPRLLEIAFSESNLDAGFYQLLSTDPDDIAVLSIRNCRMQGLSWARAFRAVMDADTVAGGVAWSTREPSIRNCTFLGGATGIYLTGAPRGVIAGNVLEHYAVGMDLREAEMVVEDNTIRQCATGVAVSGEWSEIVRNNIADGGIGISASAYDVRIRENRIVGGTGPGIRVEDVALVVVQANVIGKQSGVGLAGEWLDSGSSAVVDGNTLFRNGSSGVALIRPPGYCVVEKNIGAENGEWGLRVEGSEPTSMACNDWSGNGLGPVSGVAGAPQDLSVAPMFCDVDNADVRLDSASPLVNAAGCGRIGALGVGCGVTATVVQRFAAARVDEGIRVVWQVAESANTSEIWLERSGGLDGVGWARPFTERSFENGAVVELDRTTAIDRAYWYQLVALEGGQAAVIGSPIRVEAQRRFGFRLAEVGPNPGSGPVRIGFSLERTAAVELDVFDVQGRRVASPGRGTWPAGMHAVEWDGRTRSGELARAGVYIVRYAYPGGLDRRAIVRVR